MLVTEYKLTAKKSMVNFMNEKTFTNYINLIIHTIPFYPTLLQGTLIDRIWEKIEKNKSGK